MGDVFPVMYMKTTCVKKNLAICFSFSLFLTVSDPWNSTSGWNGSDPVVYRSFNSPDG